MTTRPCDFFGGSAKSVLNKPLLHAIQREDAGVGGGTSLADGYQDRFFNEILTNEIPGAVVASNEITLPAGEYYIQARASGYRIGVSNVRIVDSANASLINGSANALGSTATTSTDGVVSGRITITETTKVIKLRQYSQTAQTNSGLGILGGAIVASGGLVHAEISIWKIDSNVETPVISDPSMVLARPLFHAQQSSSNNTAVAGSIGDNLRLLNTTKTNEISGASLSSSIVTLPAGTYYIEGWASAYKALHYCAKILVDDVDTLVGTDCYAVSAGSDINPSIVNGRITLTSESEVKLVTDHEAAGNTVVTPTADPLPDYISADLRIWQLDAVVKQPVLVNDKLYPLPGNVIVTGNMHGLEYEYNTVDTFTVQAGICMDSLNETALTLTNPQLVDLNNSTQNPEGLSPDTVYNIFLTDDSQLIKVDTDVNGANLPVGDKRRWIGFVLTNSSGDLFECRLTDNVLEFPDPVTVFTGVGSSTQVIDASPFVPASRINAIRWVVKDSGTTITGQAIRAYSMKLDGSSYQTIIENTITSADRDAYHTSIHPGVKMGASSTSSTSAIVEFYQAFLKR